MPVGQSSGAKGKPPIHSSGGAAEQLTFDFGRGAGGRFDGPTGRGGRRTTFDAPKPSGRSHRAGRKQRVHQPELPFPKPAPAAKVGGIRGALKYAGGNKGKVALGAGAALFAGNRMATGRGSTPGNRSLYG